MKKVFMIIALMAISISAVAQSAKQQKRITEVRALYAEAMSHIKACSELPEADNHLVIDIQRMMPGTGMQNKKLSYYCDVADTEDDLYKWNTYFFRCSYNIAALNYTEEYLLDAETQQPVFIFFVGNTYQHDGTVEKRYYFNADGTPCFMQITHKDGDGGVISKEVVKDINDNLEALEMVRSFHDNMNVYNTVMGAGFHE